MEPDGPTWFFTILLLFSDLRSQWIFPGSVRPACYQSLVWQGACVSDGSIRSLVVVLLAWEVMGDGDSSPHQRWVTLERSAPGRGACQYTTPPRHRRRRRTAGGFQRDPAVWDPERLNACLPGAGGLPSVHHRTCTRPQRRLAHCQAEPVNRNSTVVPGFTLHPAIKDTCSPGSLSKHGFMPPLFCIFCAAVHDMT
jgi:hypothetical protein